MTLTDVDGQIVYGVELKSDHLRLTVGAGYVNLTTATPRGRALGTIRLTPEEARDLARQLTWLSHQCGGVA